MPNWVSALFFIPVVIFGLIGSYHYVADRRDARRVVARFDAWLEWHERMERLREECRAVDDAVDDVLLAIEKMRYEMESMMEEE